VRGECGIDSCGGVWLIEPKSQLHKEGPSITGATPYTQRIGRYLQHTYPAAERLHYLEERGLHSADSLFLCSKKSSTNGDVGSRFSGGGSPCVYVCVLVHVRVRVRVRVLVCVYVCARWRSNRVLGASSGLGRPLGLLGRWSGLTLLWGSL